MRVTIESNVPIPEKVNTWGFLNEMTEGQSAFIKVPKSDVPDVQKRAISAAYQKGLKVVSRTVKNGIRIWKLGELKH